MRTIFSSASLQKYPCLYTTIMTIIIITSLPLVMREVKRSDAAAESLVHVVPLQTVAEKHSHLAVEKICLCGR